MKKILVTGALGQIGSELIDELRLRYGRENVIGSDIKEPGNLDENFPFEIIDVLNRGKLEWCVEKYNIDTVYHLAAVLSAKGEKNPQLAFNVNINGLYNVLEIGREYGLEKIMVPSSIAAFGPDTPRENTPNKTILRPTTMYGISKVTGELLGNYYYSKFGVDVRGVRYPGIISSKTLPGGGTTDYAVEIFYSAIKNREYTCYLEEDTRLPMMYMPDAVKGLIDLAEAESEDLTFRADYNIASINFTPGELAGEIKRLIPDFTVRYEPDSRQEIADSWPSSIDDSPAREDWGWTPEHDLRSMTEDMIDKLRRKLHGS